MKSLIFILILISSVCQEIVQSPAQLFLLIALLRCNSHTMLLLLLSRFSRVRLCDPRDGSPPVPVILQARTLEWVAISFSNTWKWKVKVKSRSPVWLLATPMDCSLPGSSVHGIFQAGGLEWGAIAFSITYHRFLLGSSPSGSREFEGEAASAIRKQLLN